MKPTRYCAACLCVCNGEYCDFHATIIRRGEAAWTERNEAMKQGEVEKERKAA